MTYRDGRFGPPLWGLGMQQVPTSEQRPHDLGYTLGCLFPRVGVLLSLGGVVDELLELLESADEPSPLPQPG